MKRIDQNVFEIELTDIKDKFSYILYTSQQ